MSSVNGSGHFLILEGADGCGKTTLLRALVDMWKEEGREVVVPSRSEPDGDAVHGRLAAAIADYFAAGDNVRLPNRLLLTAAATQYQALYYGQIKPALDAGILVVTDGWWNKTWARLFVEACRSGLPDRERQDYRRWAESLFIEGHLEDRRLQTILVDTPKDVRTAWYEAKTDPEVVFDAVGRDTTDPAAFGEFTEELQELLRQTAAERDWKVVRNDGSRSTSIIAKDISEIV